MKKRLSYVFIFLFMLVFPMLSRAASVSVSLSCPTSASQGAIVDCKVNVTSDVKVNGVSGKFTFSGLSYSDFSAQSGFTVYNSSASGFSVGNTSGKSGTFTVGVIKVKVGAAGTLQLHSLDVSDTNFSAYSPSSKSASIRLKSTNNKLSGLSLSSGTLSPAFNANTKNYTATLDAASVTINATKGDNYQKITGTGKKNLNYGSNTFKIVVTSESGASNTYTIVITRPDNRNTNNNLKSLSVDKGSISFNKKTTSYSIKVASDVTSVVVSATLEDSKASFVKNYGPRTVKLNYGTNNVQIKVKAENESVKVYTIKVNREDNRSKNNSLKSLSLSDGTISFSKDVTEYSATVSYDVTKIDVSAIVEDSKSKVSISSTDLVVGNNVITVTVTAENGSTKVYKINVKRLSEAAVLSDNNNVTSIKVLGHDFEFNPEVTEYDLTIGDEYALVMEVELEDPTANYVIDGNSDLKDKSVIKVIVTSESGKQKEYKFYVKKQVSASSSSFASNIIFGIVGFVLGLITMYFVLMFVNKSKKSNIDKSKKEKNTVVETKNEDKVENE